MSEYLDLILSFAKIGVFTFGGGLTMLPLLEEEIVNKKKWCTKAELLDYYAIGQCTPGIIAVNTATFIGNKRKGLVGGVLATLGMILPSIIIILVIAFCLEGFMQEAMVQSAFKGIRVGVCAILALSVYSLFKSGVKDMLGFIGFLISFILVAFLDISPVYIVIAIIILGIIKTRLKGGN